jgi:dipeptidyl aminopeptidase/acylaminoacyl peptidase
LSETTENELRAVSMSPWVRGARRALLLLAVSCGAATALPAVAEPIPVGDFFKPAEFSNLRVSPSGKRLSATVPGANGRLQLAVLDLQDLSKSKIVAAYADADVVGVAWVNDDRLVFSLYDSKHALAQQRGNGLFAVDALGSAVPRTLIRPQYREMGELSHITRRILDPNHALEALLRDGSNDVIVGQYLFGNTGELLNVNLLRLDTMTGITRSLSEGVPDGVTEWTLDWQGRPRAVIATQGDVETTYWKATPDAAWTQVAEARVFSDERPLNPIYVDAGNHLYASARVSTKEQTRSLVSIDMAAGLASKQPVLSAEGFDFTGSLVRNGQGTVLGVRYLTDARATYWFDAGMKKIQAQVDALLPGTNNALDCGNCDERAKVLVTSTSDREPGAYRLFDTATGKLIPIVESRPWIKPKTMALRDMARITARDGLDLPLYITRPAGQKGPLPMVVLVHGGPWVRGGEWGWYPESQFLASRGYVVVEPEFRGSTGFGFKHFHAGWKQWGLAMQDDVADAALWAVKQGYADPKRICIAGASYGGYATLMGLIRNPEIFRCGFEWVGVTDIDLMYSIDWSDSGDQFKRYGMPLLIGDRTKDAAQLAATSPIKLADKLTQPLLMAYGGVDVRVPIEHGTAFRDAVRKHNPNVEWIVYPNEGHGWLLPANNVDFWTRVERFLDKNLKNAP